MRRRGKTTSTKWQNNATGEIAFASQPKLKFPIRVQRIEPAAQAKENGNVLSCAASLRTTAKTGGAPA